MILLNSLANIGDGPDEVEKKPFLALTKYWSSEGAFVWSGAEVNMVQIQ